MNPADLALDGRGWLRLLVGGAIWLLPGLALADRLLPRLRTRWILAPVGSWSLLTLSAVAGHNLLGLRVTAASTYLLALGWALALQAPRLARLLDPDRPPTTAWRPALPSRRAVLMALGVLLAAGLVAAVHTHPHLEGGQERVEVWEAYPVFLDRLAGGVQGQTDPYPMHVDEQIHLARAAHVAREGVAAAVDPYSLGPLGADDRLQLKPDVREVGFWVGLGQLQLALGIPWGALFRFLPALWAGHLAVVLWATLRPAPGALASAAFVAVLPTTVMFMGVGFLVPIAFAVAWIPAVLWVALRSQGLARGLGIPLLITAATYVHLLAGGITVLVGLLVPLLMRGRIPERLAVAAATSLPLVWLLPTVRTELLGHIGQDIPHTLSRKVFETAGPLVSGLAVLGAALVFLRDREAERPHRVLAALAGVLLLVFTWALATGHTSLATWYRPVSPFFLCVAALAGLAVGVAGEAVGRLLADRPRQAVLAGGAVGVLLVAVALPFALQNHLATPFYHLHDDEEWQRAAGFAATDAGPEDRFLSDPWQAPVLNAFTGALPHTVLYPGGPPQRGEDWAHYLDSEGADAQWLEQRGLNWVVAEVPPDAPHDEVAPGVYRLR